MKKNRIIQRMVACTAAFVLSLTSFYTHPMSANAQENLQYAVKGTLHNVDFKETPVGIHGALSVKKTAQYKAPTIVDRNGTPVLLRGVSTHGVQWFPQYVNETSFQSMRDEWGINMVRLAVYPREGGYTSGSKALMDQKIKEGVDAAKKLGMYVIIDWHVLSYNPNETLGEAKSFFKQYAQEYKDCENVIFEICNEPTGTPWYNGSGYDLYSYCTAVAKVIRDCGADNIIICGTNDWSQRVDEVAAKPLADAGFDNIMYSLHFYAATHYDGVKSYFQKAIDAGTPLFISEFGTCDASGNGGYDFQNANAWIELMEKNNVSYANWSLCNKGEAASILRTSCSKTGNWTASDLTQSGIWLVNTSRRLADKEAAIQEEKPTPEKEEKPTPEKEEKPTPEKEEKPTPEKEEKPTPEKEEKPTPEQDKNGKVTAEVANVSEWDTGAVVNIQVTNQSGTAISDWVVEFDFNGEISNLWCGKIKNHSGNHYVISAESYNRCVANKSTTSFGFQAVLKSGERCRISGLKVIPE